MNRYGTRAKAHWRIWRPNELSQLANPEEFFSTLGLEVEGHIDRRAAEMAGDDPCGEGYWEKVGRLRMARFMAEEQILREMVLLPPEPGHPHAEEQDRTESQHRQDEQAQAAGFSFTGPWLPTTIGPEHPSYHDFDHDLGLRNRQPLSEPMP